MMAVFALDSRLATALAVAGGLGLLGGLLIATAAGELRGRRKARVPASFRPGPSDEELERNVLERYLMWSAVFAVFMAIWLPAYWLREPIRLSDKRAQILDQEINAATSGNTGGHKLFQDFCASCHGPGGEGAITPFFIDGKAVRYPEPPLKYVYSRYQKAGRNEEEITQLINDAINRGRPGTPMPTWGIAFGGPFISHQVDTIVRYIRSIQEPFEEAKTTDGEELFALNCAQCHGPDGSGTIAGNPVQGGIGPNLQVALERITPEQVLETIKKGRLNINRPSMPAWAHLGEKALEALVRYIESIQRSSR